LDREFVRQFVDQHSGFYSWSTFSSSPSVSDDVGVLFENDRHQRERLYKSLKLIVMKLVASKCNFLCQKCAKTHLRAFVTSKTLKGREGGEGQRREREGKEGKRWEGRGGEGKGGRAEKRKGGEGREGRGEQGKGEVNPPPANPRSATVYGNRRLDL
jgi:hypothetical protein